MILKWIIGRGFRGVDDYVSTKPEATLVATNMGGQTARARAREVAGLRSARPGVGKAVGHLVLSHDPSLPDLTPEQWCHAIAIARAEHDLRDAPFRAVLHADADHRHVHLFFCELGLTRLLSATASLTARTKLRRGESSVSSRCRRRRRSHRTRRSAIVAEQITPVGGRNAKENW